LWSTGATTQSITVSVAGTYSVTVTDANGCVGTCQATLTVNPNPTCSVTPSSAEICAGSSQTFTVYPNCGTPPYTYLWSNAATTESITVSVAGTYSVKVTDAKSCTTRCQATLTVLLNDPPTCNFDLPPSANANDDITVNFTYTDPQGVGHVVNVYASLDDCDGVTSITFGGGTGTVHFTAPAVAPPGGFCHICLTVVDACSLRSVCCDSIEITGEPPNRVVIPDTVYQRYGDSIVTHACINPGDFFEIPINLNNFEDGVEIGGFELEVEFDYLNLTFFGAQKGDLLNGDTTIAGIRYTWEYFNYRLLPCPLCACCKYKILLYGQAEMPNGPTRLGYCLPDTFNFEDPAPANDLVWLKFQVANNDLLRGLCLPINWEWEAALDDSGHILQDWDCTENTMSSCDGEVLFVSADSLHEYRPWICSDSVEQHSVSQTLTFTDGCIFVCERAPDFKCTRGDINLDHIANTTADAVLFARYFVYGINVAFYPEPERTWQVCASDVNADGRTLMLSDLIYLIRVIQNDAVPYPKLGPSSDVVNVIVSDGKITVECASAIGGLLFKFDGNVTPTLLNTNMDLLSNESNVLVWSSAGNSIAGASELLNTSGAKLVSVMAVDREGRDLATTITTKLTPTAFALHPAYPNPFNPNTNLSFTLPNATAYGMNIYNVAGQLVRSYEGMGNVGLNVIAWDGKDNAGSDVSSGIYFYKLSAGSFTATNKMVMLK
jgi:hypothetical protein